MAGISKPDLKRKAGTAARLAACALLVAGIAHSADRGKQMRNAQEPRFDKAFATSPEFLAAAPSGAEARLHWARAEADRLRALAPSPREERARVLLAALSVVVTSELEKALAAGDIASALAFRELLVRKLPGTRPSLERIAQHGAGGGDFALGVLALHGIFDPRNDESACRRFALAWAHGFDNAAFRLSNCVQASDPARAQRLLVVAADLGHAMASEQLGRRCLESTPQDLQCAIARIAAASEAGRPSAKSVLGWMYSHGAGVGADAERAHRLYLEAARAGDLSALNNLGEMHETGRGVAKDGAKAAAFYREGAEAGFAPAQFNLGRLYATGTVLPRDVEKARGLLRAAAKGGIAQAQDILDWMEAQEADTR